MLYKNDIIVREMKILLLVLSLLGSIVLEASVVYWDKIYISQEGEIESANSGEIGDGIALEWWVGAEGIEGKYPWYASFGVNIYSEKNRIGRITGVSPGTSSYILLTAQSYWSVAYAGDIITESYVKNGQLFYDGLAGVNIDEEFGETVSVRNGDSLYLAFLAPVQGGEDGEDYLYGWVELGVKNNQLDLLSSAFSTDSLYVGGGAIPEPSGGLLLLLGAGCIALRRRKRVVVVGCRRFCCATKVAPLRNAGCFVAQQTVSRCARHPTLLY